MFSKSNANFLKYKTTIAVYTKIPYLIIKNKK